LLLFLIFSMICICRLLISRIYNSKDYKKSAEKEKKILILSNHDIFSEFTHLNFKIKIWKIDFQSKDSNNHYRHQPVPSTYYSQDRFWWNNQSNANIKLWNRGIQVSNNLSFITNNEFSTPISHCKKLTNLHNTYLYRNLIARTYIHIFS
jgi:hypothetical protein